MERLALQSIDVPDSGSLRGDLGALQHGARETFVRGRGQFVARLLREAGHHPEITDLLDAVLHTYRRVLARAVSRGELDPEVDQELMIDLLIGPLWTRLLITRGRVVEVRACADPRTGPVSAPIRAISARDVSQPTVTAPRKSLRPMPIAVAGAHFRMAGRPRLASACPTAMTRPAAVPPISSASVQQQALFRVGKCPSLVPMREMPG